ncbi:uncharacterized protein LOC120427723 [Culex pipiens pallens]|uniref:uncharacterized protein LOC120427723 n=1 Tax=Culex pipiens pallens TaxID=42434 RepID=UPI001954A104|nr:uncharacterized protein LOC120427723 [Culex pipiens pallens]
MNPAGQPRSVKRLANKRRQIKMKIGLLHSRMTTEGNQLPSIPEIRVFAKNITAYYSELDQVLRDVEESDLFADERDAHDLECAEIEGLLQGANLKIVAFSSALPSQPVQATVPQQCQHQPPVSTGKLETDDPPVADANSMPDRSHQPEKPPAMHHGIEPPAEPEVVRHKASARVRGDVTVSGDLGVTLTLRSEERKHGDLDVGWCQPVELGSLLPAEQEREDAESGSTQAVPRPEIAGLVDEDPHITPNQVVKGEEVRSLHSAEADELNVEDRSIPSSTVPVCTATTIQGDSAKKPSNEMLTYNSRTKLYNASVTRSDRERVANHGKAVSNSTNTKARLVWDPGV